MIIWAIAKTTIGDMMRKKVLWIFLIVAMGMIGLSLAFSKTLSFSTQAGSSSDFMMLKSFGMGLIAVAGLFISLVMGVSLIPQEIERRTIYTILSKPVKRYEFIIGKLLGAILTLAICIGAMGAVFVGVVMFKAATADQGSVPLGAAMAGADSAKVVPIQIFDPNTILSVVMIYLQFLVLTSVVVLFSVFLTPTVNFFLGAGVYIVGLMGSITETLSGAGVEKANAFVAAIYKFVHVMIPNFDKFNITNQLLHPETQVANIWHYTGLVSGYAILYVLIVMTLAIVIFESKEV